MNLRGLVTSLGAGGSLIAAALCALVIVGGIVAVRGGPDASARADAADVVSPAASADDEVVRPRDTVAPRAARPAAEGRERRARAPRRTVRRQRAGAPRRTSAPGLTPSTPPPATPAPAEPASPPPAADEPPVAEPEAPARPPAPAPAPETGTVRSVVRQAGETVAPVVDAAPEPVRPVVEGVVETVDQVAGTVDETLAPVTGLLP